MTNTQKLIEKIGSSGLKMAYIADCLGISRQGFRNKLLNKSEFRASEIQELCKILSIDASEKEHIFFAGV